MTQTAVEFLKKICKDRGYHLMEEYFEEAKEMENRLLEEEYERGYDRGHSDGYGEGYHEGLYDSDNK